MNCLSANRLSAKVGVTDKCNAYSVISRVDYEAIMQRIIQLQDKTIKKEKRDYWIISRFDVLGGCKGALRGTPPPSPPLSTPLPTAPPLIHFATPIIDKNGLFLLILPLFTEH